MSTSRKALLIGGVMHGIETDDTTKEVVKDYGPVVRQEHCPCKGNAHLVEGPTFLHNMRRVYQNIPWKGSVDTIFHDGVYCLPENTGKFWCNRLHAIGDAARRFLDKEIGFKEFKEAVKGECHCGKITAKDSDAWSDKPLCEEHLAEWRRQMSEDIYLRGERSPYAYLGDWRDVAP